jgi:ABC-type nitrate/sulfonate/bicarbonate transport system substrate-binding protein
MALSKLIALCCALILCKIVSANAQPAPIKVRAGYSSIAAGNAVIWVTKAARKFEANGLDVDLVYLQNPALSAQALIAGSIRFALMGGASALEAQLKGADLLLLASTKKVPSLVYLVTSKRIVNLQQLKGSTLGVSRIGTTPDLILRWTLRQIGLNPEKDTKILQVGNSPLRLAALQTGRIDGTILTVDDKVTADKLNLNILLDLRKLGIEWLEADLVSTRAVTANESTIAQKFVKALVEGIHYFKTHKEDSMAIMAKHMVNVEPKAIEAGYDFHAEEYQPKPYPSVKAIRLALEEISRRNPAAREVQPAQFFDAQFVTELDQNGFIESLYRR